MTTLNNESKFSTRRQRAAGGAASQNLGQWHESSVPNLHPLLMMAANDVGVDFDEALDVDTFCDWYTATMGMVEHVAQTRSRLEAQFARSAQRRSTLGKRKERSDARHIPEHLLMDPNLTSGQVGAMTGANPGLVRTRRKKAGYVPKSRGGWTG